MRRWLGIGLILGSALLLIGAVTVVNLSTQVTGLLARTNGGTGVSSTATYPAAGVVTVTVASGTAAMGTSAVASGVCSTTVTVAAAGVLTSDATQFSLTVAPSGVNFYSWLHVYSWPTAGNVNFAVCNPSSASRTPTAMTLNWRVTR